MDQIAIDVVCLQLTEVRFLQARNVFSCSLWQCLNQYPLGAPAVFLFQLSFALMQIFKITVWHVCIRPFPFQLSHHHLNNSMENCSTREWNWWRFGGPVEDQWIVKVPDYVISIIKTETRPQMRTSLNCLFPVCCINSLLM